MRPPEAQNHAATPESAPEARFLGVFCSISGNFRPVFLPLGAQVPPRRDLATPARRPRQADPGNELGEDPQIATRAAQQTAHNELQGVGHRCGHPILDE